MTQTILIAEDEPVQREMLSKVLSKRLNYEVVATTNGQAAVDRVMDGNIDTFAAVILDLNMPQMNGFEALKVIRKFRPDLPVILLTASDETEDAVRAIKEGASDFLVKPPSPEQLDVAIKNAIRLSTLSRELNKMKRDKEGALSFSDIVGHNAGLSAAVALGRKAAASHVPVLITGEVGSGRELFARAIHGESKRVGAPFIAINCSAIPSHLVESTLFGPEKGAVRRAEGGTLFLDDAERLSQEDQVRLLRLLQHKDLDAPSLSKPLKVNVRVIAATGSDIVREVEAQRFREDLYFRLNILAIHLPALRERPGDIVPIAEYFIERLAASEGLMPKPLERKAKLYLTAQHWPGNIRELENLIHRAMVLADEDEIDEQLLTQIHQAAGAPAMAERRSTPGLQVNMRLPDGRFKTMEQLEQEAMRMALMHFEDNVTQAADALGIAKSTFYRKLKETPNA